MEINVNFCTQYDAEKLFNQLIKFDESRSSLIKTWINEENGRLNRKIYFTDDFAFDHFTECFEKPSSNIIKKLQKFNPSYISPFGKEKIGNLERIQIIRSNEPKNQNRKGNHLFNFHVDRINTYKQILLCSEVTEECGPFQIAELKLCKDEAMKILERLKQSVANGDDWREINSSLDCQHFISATGSPGDLVTVDGREPHRAGQLKPGKTRAIIIFEYMTREASQIYKSSFYND